jgi:hypothetical protein
LELNHSVVALFAILLTAKGLQLRELIHLALH